MALPSVNITFSNGALGRTAATTDGVVGLICQITAQGTVTPGTAYLLRSMATLTNLGITKAVNPVLWDIAQDFYNTAGNGAALWIVGTTTQTIEASINAHTETIVRSSNFDVKTVFVYNNTFSGVTITGGFNADLHTAVTAAQTAATSLLNNFFAPVTIVIDGNTSYDGTAAAAQNYSVAANNRVAVYLGKKTSVEKTTTTLGLFMGRLAISPVHRNVGRVKDGAISTSQLYVGTQLAELHDVATLHDKGYISIRTFVGKSGYYFTDDRLLTVITDDYSQITNRRVVDKAYRIAYTTIVNELLDEIPVTATGTIEAHKARVIEGLIVTAISNAMSANGELNVLDSVPNDKGVVVTVDETNNVLSTSQIKITIGVRPYGYSRLITIQLGFKTN